MYKQIEEMIKNKNKRIDANTLRYYTNYFYVVLKKGLLPDKISLEDLIDNTLYFAKKIVFYDSNHKIYKRLGSDVKGMIDPKTKTLYVRENLSEPLREMVVYHELHHAAQTNKENNQIGINNKSNIGCLIMEAQTQWFAEEVYKEIYDVDFSEKKIESNALRLSEGGIVVTSLHNYEMYDSMLSKLSIILDVPKEFFVTINYLYDKDYGLKLLEKKYNEKKKEKNIECSFYDLLYLMDYVYVVDYFAYVNNPDKKVLLDGKITNLFYQIHPKRKEKLSLQEQKRKIDTFDTLLILALIENNFDFTKFSKYVFDIEKREVLLSYMESKKNHIKLT